MPDRTEPALIDLIKVKYDGLDRDTIKCILPCGCTLTVQTSISNQYKDPVQFRYTCDEHFDW